MPRRDLFRDDALMREGTDDEQFAWLMQAEIAAGAEGLAEAVGDLSRNELERLLCYAVVRVTDLQDEADREMERLTRRLNKSRSGEVGDS